MNQAQVSAYRFSISATNLCAFSYCLTDSLCAQYCVCYSKTVKKQKQKQNTNKQGVTIDGIVNLAGESRECAGALSPADQFHFLGLGPFTGIRSGELDSTVLKIDPVLGLDMICCSAVV